MFYYKLIASYVFIFFIFIISNELFAGSSEHLSIYEKKNIKLTEDIILLTFVNVVLSIFGFLVIYRTLHSNMEANKSYANTSSAELRPYINIKEAELTPVYAGGEHDKQFLYFSVNIKLENKGKTPALELKLKKSTMKFSDKQGNSFKSSNGLGINFIGPDDNQQATIEFFESSQQIYDCSSYCTCYFDIQYKSVFNEKSLVKFILQLSGSANKSIIKIYSYEFNMN